MTSERVLLAVDGNSLVHRAFHAQAGAAARSPDGRPIWAVRGLLAQLAAAAERIAPDAVVVGFDDPIDSLRRQQWPQYKANRADKLATLVDQLAIAAEVLRGLRLAVVIPPGLEADDVLASAARYAPTVGARTVVVTSDRDAFALIDERTSVLRIIDGGVDASPLLTAPRLAGMLGVRPEQYRDFAALRGDPSDNLPGVRGIGPKTAARLLVELGSAQAAFDDAASGGGRVARVVGAAVARRLASPPARAVWELNCQVMAMRHDVPLGLDLAAGAGRLPLDAEAVRAAYQAHQLTSTTATALRALAHQDIPVPARMAWAEPADAIPAAYSWSDPTPDGGWRRRPFGRLAKRPKWDQLSLFDATGS